MEIVDNLVLSCVPGAMDAGLASPLFWGALALALVAASWSPCPSIITCSPTAKATP